MAEIVCVNILASAVLKEYFDGKLRFCENQLKVSDIEGKMMLTT